MTFHAQSPLYFVNKNIVIILEAISDSWHVFSVILNYWHMKTSDIVLVVS